MRSIAGSIDRFESLRGGRHVIELISPQAAAAVAGLPEEAAAWLLIELLQQAMVSPIHCTRPRSQRHKTSATTQKQSTTLLAQEQCFSFRTFLCRPLQSRWRPHAADRGSFSLQNRLSFRVAQMFSVCGHESVETWIRNNVNMFAGVGLGPNSHMGARGTIGCKPPWQ